jgi:fumarate reductase iron-sulfur subunit
MKLTIKRDEKFVEYRQTIQNATLLEILDAIKTQEDSSLSFTSGCRSGVCGSCAVRVNEKEVLACSYKVQEGDVVEPLKGATLLRDLVVDMDRVYAFNAKAKAWLIETQHKHDISPEDAHRNEIQSDCILCSACYSACPVYAVNEEFLGPFALTRVWKYVSDKREAGVSEKIAHVQSSGVWDCTLCNACTLVCPQGISSKMDIEKLRAKSAQEGFMDPSFGSFGGFGGGFDGTPLF